VAIIMPMAAVGAVDEAVAMKPSSQSSLHVMGSKKTISGTDY
jgi:hypothetical protein